MHECSRVVLNAVGDTFVVGRIVKTGKNREEQGDSLKFFCLLEELETSHELIRSGFGHLQEIDMGNTFYHLPHLLMASGFERLMKCYISLVYDGQHGSYPDKNYVTFLGHNLECLLKRICADFYGGKTRPFVQREFDFITTDWILKERCPPSFSSGSV